jgi:predicted small metal-binding protein
MIRCSRPGCGWQAIAASRQAAAEQYARHLVETHSTEESAEIPDEMVQVRAGDDNEWQTVTLEEAKRLHALQHEDDAER